MNKIKYFIVALMFTPLLSLKAGIVSKVETTEDIYEVNKEFSITLKFANNANSIACGVMIDWGDGKVERFRVGDGQQIPPPYKISHYYSTPENYKMRIVGEALIRGLRSVPACGVALEGVVQVVDPVVVARNAQEKAEADKVMREKQEMDAVRLANERTAIEAARVTCPLETYH